jgi:hypothetical protein
MSYRSAVSIAALALLSFSGAVLAQPRWGSGEMPRSGACFYDDVNMRGQYFCVRPGEDLASLPGGMSDRISSIRIIGDADVVVYRDVRFRGPSARFVTDARDLRREGMSDAISSIRVEARRGGGWTGERGPSWGHEPPPREGACFYQDANFRGQYFCVPRGATYVRLPPGFNDRISSVRLFRATAVIFSDADFGGRSSRLTSNTPYLGRSWNDRVSSIRVY